MVDKSPQKIKSMFDKISDKYDFINNLMSFGTHFLIKKDCINQLQSGAKILDLCCGTGDLTRILRKKYPDAEVFGVDFSGKMLNIAVEKETKSGKLKVESGKFSSEDQRTGGQEGRLIDSGKCKVESGKLNNFRLSTFNFQLNESQPSIPPYLHTSLYLQADATNLPFEDNTFDIVTIGFGLRNIENFYGAIDEIYRVLKPYGQFMHLDFGEKNFLNKMFDKIIPNIINIFTKNNEAYSYLVKSKSEFYAPDELIKIFEQKGFKLLRRKDYLFGAISCQIMSK